MIESYRHFMLHSDKISEEDREEYKKQIGYYDKPITPPKPTYVYEPVKRKKTDYDLGLFFLLIACPPLLVLVPVYLLIRLFMYVIDDLTGNKK